MVSSNSNPPMLPQRARTVKQTSNRNYGAAFFQMITIALLCTSLAQPSWLTLISRSAQPGENCPKHLTLHQFVDYGYFETTDTFNATNSAPIRMLYHSSSGGMFLVIYQHFLLMIHLFVF